jgi:glyceraldehyde 3-phosphate dehydrogenase
MQQGNQYETELQEWIQDEKSAIELIHIVGQFWFENSIELVIFRNQLVDRSASEILNLHNYARTIVGKSIVIQDTLILAKDILEKDVAPSRIDIGKLTYEFHLETNTMHDSRAFVIDRLKDSKNSQEIKPKDVVLYGFGRIGRLLAREMMSKIGKGQQLRLRAIVTRDKNDAVLLEKRASLLRYDSVHGDFEGWLFNKMVSPRYRSLLEAWNSAFSWTLILETSTRSHSSKRICPPSPPLCWTPTSRCRASSWTLLVADFGS